MGIDIRDFGAVGDGATLNTAPLQSAIDRCHADGGGTVVVSPGTYVTGTLRLKSGVVLDLQTGATILGSRDLADYAPDCGRQMYRDESHMDRCLIYAEGVERIGIIGQGIIDGRGRREHFPHDRPMLMRLVDCANVRLRDVTLTNPASWTSAWLYCRDIVVSGVRIHSRANGNGDGLDFDGCCDVRVSDCSFDTSDDSICLQTSRPDHPCRDIVVSNCTFCSRWAGMRIGLLSRGDFENVAVSNCVFRDIDDSGLKIQMCEGATMRRMAFSNLVMTRVPRPVFLTLCQQRACVDAPKGVAPCGQIRDLQFSQLLVDNTACGPESGIVVVGLPGHPVENVSFSHVDMVSGGGGTGDDAARAVPELDLEALAGHWPEYTCFGGALPAHGVYARHVRSLRLHEVHCRTVSADARAAVVLDDVDYRFRKTM